MLKSKVLMLHKAITTSNNTNTFETGGMDASLVVKLSPGRNELHRLLVQHL